MPLLIFRFEALSPSRRCTATGRGIICAWGPWWSSSRFAPGAPRLRRHRRRPVAQLRPFRGVRYDLRVVGDLGAVVSAPYDIISPAAQRDYLARSPYNAVRLELPSDEPNDAAAHGRYRRAAAIYQQWLASGVLLAEHQAGFFLYEERFSDRGIERVRRSLLTPVRLADWREGIILPHEFTLSGPKQDRLNLLRATGVQFSPILALYDDPGDIGTVLDEVAHGEPVAELRLANGAVAAAAHTHRLWRIMDPR